jgi:hypothetical protein
MDEVVQWLRYSISIVVELVRQARALKCTGMGKLSGGGIDWERSIADAEGSSKTRDAALEEERWGARGTGRSTSGGVSFISGALSRGEPEWMLAEA